VKLVQQVEKAKSKSHALDIAPLSEGTSLQKRSGMARVVEGFHSLPAHTRVYDPYLPLLFQSKLVLIY